MSENFSYALIAIAIIGLATACSKRSDDTTVAESLIGTWQWVRSDGGFAAHIHETPASTGKNIELKITADGNYITYVNGIATAEATYILEKRKCIHDHTEKVFIKLSSGHGFMIEEINIENLMISDEAHDGIGSNYKRKHASSR